jgi:hypothetical protein
MRRPEGGEAPVLLAARYSLLSTEANLRTEIAAGFDRLKLSASKRGDDYGIEIGRNGRLKKW